MIGAIAGFKPPAGIDPAKAAELFQGSTPKAALAAAAISGKAAERIFDPGWCRRIAGRQAVTPGDPAQHPRKMLRRLW